MLARLQWKWLKKVWCDRACRSPRNAYHLVFTVTVGRAKQSHWHLYSSLLAVIVCVILYFLYYRSVTLSRVVIGIEDLKVVFCNYFRDEQKFSAKRNEIKLTYCILEVYYAAVGAINQLCVLLRNKRSIRELVKAVQVQSLP